MMFPLHSEQRGINLSLVSTNLESIAQSNRVLQFSNPKTTRFPKQELSRHFS